GGGQPPSRRPAAQLEQGPTDPFHTLAGGTHRRRLSPGRRDRPGSLIPAGTPCVRPVPLLRLSGRQAMNDDEDPPRSSTGPTGLLPARRGRRLDAAGGAAPGITDLA